MCDHFSPLAQVHFPHIEDVQADLKRLSFLSDGNAEYIRILGGEPLLNPQICNFFLAARDCFAEAAIELFTNGLLLSAQESSFWEACKQYRIGIAVTKYPICLDYNQIKTTAECWGVAFRYTNTKPIKQSWHFPLDLNGQQDPEDCFSHCCHANTCIFLQSGKLYTCPVAPNIGIFNQYFGYELPLDEADGIDIYNAQSIDEILEFLSHPISFCKYCCVKGRKKGYTWEHSKRAVEEWILH